MTKTEAHKVLDCARAGVPTADWKISQALVVTGDLSWTDSVYQVRRRAGTWEREPSRVIAKAGFWDGLQA